MDQETIGEEFERLDQEIIKRLAETRTDSTKREYARNWINFIKWASAHGAETEPATDIIIARYLVMLDDQGKSKSAIVQARSAIANAHTVMGCSQADNPAKSPLLRETMRGIKKKQEKQARALLPQDLAAIRATATLPRRRGGKGAVRGREKPETALRRGRMDIAICMTLRDGGLRRSEAAALRWSDVEPWPDGTGRLTIRFSKTNRTGDPQNVAITPTTMSALLEIRPEGGGENTSVFGLSEKQICRRVSTAAIHAGLGPGFSGHSGRIGLARNMTQNGAPVNATMLQGRWKSAETVARYTRGENAGAALRWIG